MLSRRAGGLGLYLESRKGLYVVASWIMDIERIDILPYGRHLIEQDDVEAVTEVLCGGWLTQGPKVSELEAMVVQDKWL